MKYTQEQKNQGAELMNALVEKAWNSAAFKDQLVNNPVAAIEEFTGKSFNSPEGKKIVVEDQTNESIIYLNIPAEPNLDELELSEEQLELVSGGATPILILTIPLAEALGAVALGAGIYAAVK